MNVFEWSMPFVAQKVTEVFFHLIKADRIFNAKNDGIPIELIDKKPFFQQLLKLQKTQAHDNEEIVASYNGRTLDRGLMSNKEAKEYTNRKYKK